MGETLGMLFTSYNALPFVVKAALALSVPVLTTLFGLGIAIRMPADAFVTKRPVVPTGTASGWRPILWVVKNTIGAGLFLLGLVLALPLVPGPGALFMLLGLGIADFPGKRRLELRLLRLPRVLSSINGLRARFGRPPLIDPPS
jgi:hypothetical protein